MGMGTTAHPYPCCCACVPTRPPLFMLSCPSSCCHVRRPFPHMGHQRGILVMPYGVVDEPFCVMGGGGGAGERGTVRDTVVVGVRKGERTMMWQRPYLAFCSVFRARQLPELKKMPCFGLIGPISVLISMIQISI